MEFKENVFRAVARIPEGRVATYAQVAQLAGYPASAARAVGNAIHTNTDPVAVPCHRVVCADGSLGRGYALGGPAAQKARLEAEGIVFQPSSSRVHSTVPVPSAPEGSHGPISSVPEVSNEYGIALPRVDLARYCIVIEDHPLKPFLPPDGRILFLGSFPPPCCRWSMEFFYPNWNNDFWRIQGLIHFGDAHHFDVPGEKRFDRESIMSFCFEEGLAFYDTAQRVCRLKANASDEFLEVLQNADIGSMLAQMPYCKVIVTTGGKASEELADILGADSIPRMGAGLSILLPASRIPDGACREIVWWRMPSSSHAFPMSLSAKADYYRLLFDGRD